MRTRSLVAAALAGAALLAVPAQAAAPAAGQYCIPQSDCDPFWLFRPCGPLIKCP